MTEDRITYVIEESINSTVAILFELISTASGLSKWFCENAVFDMKKNEIAFHWGNDKQIAEIEINKKHYNVKLRWLDSTEFLKMQIKKDEITNGVSLEITDYSDEDNIVVDKQLWISQLEDLKHITGF